MPITINQKDYSDDDLKVLAKHGLLQVGQKHDTSSATPNAVPINGPLPGVTNQFGVLSSPGTRPGLWNATPRVRSFASDIPMYPTVVQQELIDVATGVTVGSGANQTSACTVGPKPGSLKAMRIIAGFGIVHESTKIFDLTQAGMRRTRADIDHEFYNTAVIQNAWAPDVEGIRGDGSYDMALMAEMMALGVEIERNVSQVHFTGIAGTEDNAFRGVARQWNGLDRLVRTGWVDAETGIRAEQADAAVSNFNQNIDGGTDASQRTIIGAMIDTYFGQVEFLNKLGISPLIALVMRPDLFRALAAVWSCSYSTTRCTSSSAGTPLQRDAVSVRAEYENILRTRTLPFEGVDVPVLLDDTAPRRTLGNNFYSADVYGLMLRGNGRPTVYGEYFDMGNPEAEQLANFMGVDGSSMVINNGLYRVFRRVTGGCLEFDFFARPRLITDAPFAHFRLDNLWYRSAYDQRDAIPGQSMYKNGGLSYRL